MKGFVKNHFGALVAWIVILLIAVFTLPDVSALTSAHSEITLPNYVQTSVAKKIQNQWGRNQGNSYTAGAVFNKKNGKLTAADKERIDNTISYLKDNKKKLGIKTMMTPNDNEAAKSQLVSKDGTTEVVQLTLSKSHQTIAKTNKALIKAVKTSGLRTYVTGAEILQNDFSASVQEGIKKTEVISVIFIFIVLVLVFRSPIVPIISLITVGVSFITSFSIVTNLVQHANFPYSNFTQVFMVIVLFGIGTDYNILLYNKFKENLGSGMEKWEATRNAQHKAGKTILYSGSSILIGFSALGLANFSLYRSATGVAIGVAVLLVVLLTLNPFFMATLGKKMFWPVKTFKGESDSKLWHSISKNTLLHPIVYLVVMAIVTVPFMLLYNSTALNYNDADEISDSTPSKQGLLVFQKHFSKGTPEASTLYIKADHPLDNEKDLKTIDQITKQIQDYKDVKLVASVTEPAGKPVKALYVNDQLKTVNKGTVAARNGLTKVSEGTSQIASGAALLQNGAGRLENGTLQLRDGAVQLQNGTYVLASGATTLQNGTQQLASGLNLMSAQLASQMNGATAAQLAQLEEGLPQINAGIQQLNQALGNSDSIDTQTLATNLTNVGTQAKTIGDNLTAAGNTLKGMQDNSQQAQTAFASAMNQAQLTDQQKQVMSAALSQIMASQENSLNSVAGNLQAAGDADQSLANSMTSVSGTMQNLQSMLGQVNTLKASVNQLASASNVALPGANQALDKLSSGLTQVQGAVAQGASGAEALNSGAGQLVAGLNQGADGAAQLSSGAEALNSGASQLDNGIGQIATNAPLLTDGVNKVNSGLGTAQNYLTGLGNSAAAKTFYIPEDKIHSDEFQESIDNYMSSNLKATKFTIIFKINPNSTKAAKEANEISKMVKKSVKGTSLSNSTIAMAGQSENIYDTRDVANSDFIRTAAIMLIGIGIALIFITRSLLQPFFILGTLLIAYLASLGITQKLIPVTLGTDLMAWNTPFFTFIMLIALGVDYSIFLMMRYRELGKEDPSLSPSQRILQASSFIGTVVISAAIILGGTFAALIPSGVPTLIEVAMGVIIGLFLLVFLLPINMSAVVKIAYEGLTIKRGKHSES
ncbi:MMPL family transporter [Lactobacillus sp. PV034]|uniref:MMPL/RND family transporter n=1 Tax=Lactobacillus sp. PV034 TaxID=2594495 RepID=UPI00223F88E2|nr:MMPL family transporter [Lactobacillus sp. PV034]QNQ81318.1 MMPL family transporter [Lactobacillus sp. PV034]